MIRARLNGRAAALVAVALTIGAANASAQTAAEAKCRDTIAKASAKYAKSVLKTVESCHKQRSTGGLSLTLDCNQLDDADTKGKLDRAASKLRSQVTGKCLASEGILPRYPECPAPATSADDGGATAGIDDFSELADCLIELANVGFPVSTVLGMGDPDQVLSASLASCQKDLGKSFTRVVTRILKERRRCQRLVDKQGITMGFECEGADPKGKIGRERVKLNAKIDGSCSLPQTELAKLNACADTTVGLRNCVGDDAADPLGSYLIRNAYVLPGGSTTTTTTGGPTTTMGGTTTTLPTCGGNFPVCDGTCPSGEFCTNTGSICECQAASGSCAPATIIRKILAQQGEYVEGVNEVYRQTQLSTGWSGTAHQIDIPGDFGSADAVDVSCDANCENCNINLNALLGDPRGYCRCSNNRLNQCDVVNGPDPDPAPNGCGGAQCDCFFGGPLAISAGGTPVCVLNFIQEDFGGTMNLRTGEWRDTLRLVSLVYLGSSTTAPCPTCNNDPTPNDGNRGGTCSGLLGGACDVNAAHPTFGPVSHDCPIQLPNISGNGLQINLEFTTGSQSLAYTLPCDDEPTFGQCPCRVCTGDGTIGCSSDADCQAASAGTCTAGGGAGVRPNQCDDIVCTDGECLAGPVDMYCDGVTAPDGRGFASCTTVADCAAAGGGQCSISENRRCYDNPIVVEGDAHVSKPARAAIFCIPPTTSTAVNASGGLPGAGTFDLEFESDIRCRGDIATPYQLPDGSNCSVVATTTTTSITLPPCDGVAPVCAGSCPPGEGCGDQGGTCGCAPTTTITLPPCGGTFPLCTGNCATGQLCLGDLLTQTCLCQAPPI